MNKELPKALVATDICVFKIIEGVLCVYLTKVKTNQVYIGKNCLPGSLIAINENAEETVERVLKERTNIESKHLYMEQLYSFSEVERDKRSRSVAIAYLGLMDSGDSYCDEDKEQGGFLPIIQVKNMAFDHKEVITLALDRLKSKVHYSTIIKKLLRGEFTFTELQKVYETVLGITLDKRNFRKKILALDLLKETDVYKKEGRMRPAMLYKWKTSKVEFYDVFGFAGMK